MFAKNKINLFGGVIRRIIKVNFSRTPIRGCTDNQPLNKKIKICDDNLHLMFDDSLETDKLKEINSVWLRENCRCNECYNRVTQQRNVLFHRLSPKAFEVESLKETRDGNLLKVLWKDKHISHYDKEWVTTTFNNEKLHFPDKKQYRWNATNIIPYTREKIDFKSFINDKATLKYACEKLYEFGFLQIENSPKNTKAIIEAAQIISDIKETYLGRIWDVQYTKTEEVNKGVIKDSVYTNDYLGPHTDGNYLTETPAFLVFQYLKVAEEGGELIIMDGLQVIEDLRQLNEQAYQILTSHLTNFCYKDEVRSFSESCPTIELDKATGSLKRIRYNHFDRSSNHMHSSSIPASDYYEALSCFSRIVEDPKNHTEFLLQPGTIFVVDNWRLIHARKAFKGARHLAGCFLTRDKWLSNLRLL